MKPNDIEKAIKEDGSCRILLNEYEEIKADERAKVIDEVDAIIDFIRNNSFDHSLEFDSFKAIGSSVIISLLEQLKKGNE